MGIYTSIFLLSLFIASLSSGVRSEICMSHQRARSDLFHRADPTQLKSTHSGSGKHAEILDMSNANQTSSPKSSRLLSSACAWKMMKAYQTPCRTSTSYTRPTQRVLLSMMGDYHNMCGYQGEETSSTSTKTTLLRSTPHGDCVPEIWIPDSYLGVYVAG
jgi:hypothetical protein